MDFQRTMIDVPVDLWEMVEKRAEKTFSSKKSIVCQALQAYLHEEVDVGR